MCFIFISRNLIFISQIFNIYLPEFNIYLPDFNIYLPGFSIYFPEWNGAENGSMAPMGFRNIEISVWALWDKCVKMQIVCLIGLWYEDFDTFCSTIIYNSILSWQRQTRPSGECPILVLGRYYKFYRWELKYAKAGNNVS